MVFKFALIIFIFFNSTIYGHVTITGRLINITDSAGIPGSSVVVNGKSECQTDLFGNFKIELSERKIEKIELRTVGIPSVQLLGFPETQLLQLDTIAIMYVMYDDFAAVIVDKDGKRYKKAEKRHKKETAEYINKQRDLAYVIYNGKKFLSINGIIRLN